MRMKKILSLILCLCMLAGMCQFTFTASAADVSERTVTMSTTRFAQGTTTFPCTISVPDEGYWWAAVYPADTTTYTSASATGGYLDYIDGTNAGGELSFPSTSASRRKNNSWHANGNLAAGEWKIVIFGDSGYTKPVDEAYFSVVAPSIKTDKAVYNVGEDITFTYDGSLYDEDFISIYSGSDPSAITTSTGEQAWAYTPGLSGAVSVADFSKQHWASNPGTYVAKYWQSDGYKVALDGITFTILAPNTTVYVSASGDDTAAGTADAPVATMAKAFEILNLDEDGTIYISGSVAFEDVAHTNTVTYAAADDTAAINSAISINGTSVIEVPLSGKRDLKTNGHYIEINAEMDTSANRG